MTFREVVVDYACYEGENQVVKHIKSQWRFRQFQSRKYVIDLIIFHHWNDMEIKIGGDNNRIIKNVVYYLLLSQ